MTLLTAMSSFRPGWQSIAVPQGCVQQGCWTQVYKDVFTTSLVARRLTAYRSWAQFYSPNSDADETMIMTLRTKVLLSGLGRIGRQLVQKLLLCFHIEKSGAEHIAAKLNHLIAG